MAVQADLMVTRRPPFTGIHEIPPKRGDPGIHEGGGKLRPYGEDIFQRVVDVNWVGTGNGGVFSSGDHCCFFRYASIEPATLDQDWIGLGSLDFGDGGIISCGSYAKAAGRPTFLMGGRGTFAVLMISHDGLKWTTVRNASFPRIDAFIWNAKTGRFYAEISSGFMSSPDGYQWQMEPGLDYQSFIAMSKTGYGDGVVGYNPANGQMIFPQDLYEVGPDGSVVNMECVGYVGGVWVAGGQVYLAEINRWNSATLSSIDNGKNWTIVSLGPIGMKGNYSVVTMLAAPHSDF